MNIGIASPISISKFSSYLSKESQYNAINIAGLKAPAVDSLVLELLKNGHNISIYTLDTEVKRIIVLRGKQLTIFVAPVINSKWWRFLGIFTYKANQIKKCINFDRKTIDVIHAHWTYEYAIGCLLSNKKVPIFVTVRDWAPAILKIFKYNYYYYVRYVLDYIVFKHKGIKFIANSEYIAKNIKKRWNIDAIIIPNPISEIFFSPKRKYRQKEKFRIVSIANNICKIKNIDRLIEAFHLFTLKYERVELLLVGKDFNDENLSVIRWKQKGIMKNVKLLGYIQHHKLIEILDQSDLLIHPSLEESFGNIFLEAMARKIPVIGGERSGAVPNILLNGKIGYLCDIKSIDSIYKSIEFLYMDNSYRTTLAEKAYSYILNNYTQSIVGKQTLNQYNKALKSK